jgi:gamma-glutamylcyclotransferase (GGCT)/AIG2-like uncharacterized protein YtfP
MENQSHKVFVYGTLKPGGHYWPQFCEGKVSAAVPAKIRGKLYDLHVGYPGMFLGGDAWVQGTVLTFPKQADFAQLDVLEGFKPNRPNELNEYVRLRVECFSPDAQRLGKVWAYEMTEATFERFTATRIESGNWPLE